MSCEPPWIAWMASKVIYEGVGAPQDPQLWESSSKEKAELP